MHADFSIFLALKTTRVMDVNYRDHMQGCMMSFVEFFTCKVAPALMEFTDFGVLQTSLFWNSVASLDLQNGLICELDYQLASTRKGLSIH
ncbi:hypothetical protein M514_22290 [Trichuris suis]|uniref:Uncharacterized protein n=1 Tax=Trichuris suis TaxID=68888 RepID=A0A085N7Y5_9BILA|nr:hypothetical protein M514_22290 [Trichuris suis]